MQTAKVIPLSVVPSGSQEALEELRAVDELTARLEATGYMAVMQIGEPRLSELVAKYKAKGYDVVLVPLVIEDYSAGGCSSASSCGTASSSGGCGSGGCGSAAAAPQTNSQVPRKVVPDISLIYVRLPN